MKNKLESESFHLVHSINAYEEDSNLVLDLLILKKFSTRGESVTIKQALYCMCHQLHASGCIKIFQEVVL